MAENRQAHPAVCSVGIQACAVFEKRAGHGERGGGEKNNNNNKFDDGQAAPCCEKYICARVFL